MKCARCGSPRATNHWELTACADGGKRRSKYLCDHHDAELNEIAMTFLGIRDAQKKASAYRGASLAAQPAAGEMVPEAFDIRSDTPADSYEHGWNACREAMLATPAAQRPGAGDVDGTHTATPCHWVEDTDSGAWDTACGQKHLFTAGDATDNGHSFCPYCAGRLISQLTSVEPQP